MKVRAQQASLFALPFALGAQHLLVWGVVGAAFFQGGRVAMTLPAKPCVTCEMYVVAESGASLLSAVVYTVKSIWVTPTEVLSTDRPDNGDTRLMSARIDREQLGGVPASVARPSSRAHALMGGMPAR